MIQKEPLKIGRELTTGASKLVITEKHIQKGMKKKNKLYMG